MAKIEESVTYKGHICTLEKCIGNINFYTYTEKENDDDGIENLLLVNKTSKEVLANIIVDYSYGAYGLCFDGYKIEKE